MTESRTVLEHLLDGRDALLLEVTRLTTAISELDAVIGRIGGEDLRNRLAAAPQQTPLTTGSSAGADQSQPVKLPAQGEDAPRESRSTSRTRSRGPRKRAPTEPAARRSAPGRQAVPARGDGQKSIRVHVLEMLAAEDRDFGLGEIIERIRRLGIQAHDDAVRSITIKLMKDGSVERVGRGQYRLARRNGAERPPQRTTQPPTSPSDALHRSDAPPAPEPVGESRLADPAAERGTPAPPAAVEPARESAFGHPGASMAAERPATAGGDQFGASRPVTTRPAESATLNLGQPWSHPTH